MKVVILQNTFQESPIPLPTLPVNCMIVPVELNVISAKEFIPPCRNYNDWVKHTKFDARLNHLSNGNLSTLVDLLAESLVTGSTDNFTYERFAQQIFEPIRNREDYDHYVKLGLIHDKPHFFTQT